MVWPLGLLSVAALPGLAVAPIIGWRFAGRAIDPGSAWVPRALAETLILAAVGWVVYVFGFLVVLGPPGPPGTEAGFLVYALAEGIVYALIPTLIVILPIGLMWCWIVRSLSRGTSPTV